MNMMERSINFHLKILQMTPWPLTGTATTMRGEILLDLSVVLRWGRDVN